MAFAAATLKTQQRWRTQYASLTADVERELKEQDRLKRGAPSEDGGQSLSQLRGDLRRLLVDRGRVWRNLGVAGIGQGTITLDATSWGDDGCYQVTGADEFDDDPVEPIPVEGEAAAADANAKPLGLQQNAIVFAFKEAPIGMLPQPVQELLYGDDPLVERDTKGFCKVPAFYLGEFKVSSDPQVDPTSVTLVPTLPLKQSQIDQLEEGSTWVLYEVLPVDSHVFLQGLSPEQLQVWLPPMTEDQERYSTILDEYVRDQTQASDMDPPARKWMKVKFTEAKADIEVDVSEPTSLPDAPFDPSGRANADDLRQLDKAQFAKGDEVVLDFFTAQEFISQGIAEAVEPIYVRRLRDYERFFRANASQIDATTREISVTEDDLAKLNDALTDLRSQVSFVTNQRQRLTEDRDGFNMELAVIQQYRQALEEQWKTLLSDLSRLYRANKQQVRRQVPAGGVAPARRSL